MSEGPRKPTPEEWARFKYGCIVWYFFSFSAGFTALFAVPNDWSTPFLRWSTRAILFVAGLAFLWSLTLIGRRRRR